MRIENVIIPLLVTTDKCDYITFLTNNEHLFAVLTYVFQLKTMKSLVLNPSLRFEMISILFEINEIDPGKWFQIVMMGLTLEISFILVSVIFIYLFYCHLYGAFSIVQCSNALYRL